MSDTPKTPRIEWSDLPALLTVEEAARLLRVSRNTCYDAIRQNEIPSIQIRGRRLIPKARLMTLLGVSPEPPAPTTSNVGRSKQWLKSEPGFLDLPPLRRVRTDRFDPDFAEGLVCGAEMPDGSLWLLHSDGSQITIGVSGDEISEALVRTVVRRKARVRR